MTRPNAKPARGTRAWAVVCRRGRLHCVCDALVVGTFRKWAEQAAIEEDVHDCGPHRIARVVVTREERRRGR